MSLTAHGPNLLVDGPADALPDAVVEQLRTHKGELLNLVPTDPTAAVWGEDDWIAYLDERAAILQLDGGVSRAEAEIFALEDGVAQWLSIHPALSFGSTDGCVHCGCGNQVSKTLLTVLTSEGHVWIHDGCWLTWKTARERRAREALLKIGWPDRIRR